MGGAGFGVLVSGFGVLVSGFGVLAGGFGVLASGFGVLASGFGVLASGCEVKLRSTRIFRTGSAAGCEAGLRPAVELSKSKWGYAPGSGLALVGQRPNRGAQPLGFFFG